MYTKSCCQEPGWKCTHFVRNQDGNVHMLSGTRIEMYTCCQEPG